MTDEIMLLGHWFEALGAARASLAGPGPQAVPPLAPPAWPRGEMTVLFRLIAAERGLPPVCRQQRCQRTGACSGAPDARAACDPLWPAADREALRLALLALALAWLGARERHEALFGPQDAAPAEPPAGPAPAAAEPEPAPEPLSSKSVRPKPIRPKPLLQQPLRSKPSRGKSSRRKSPRPKPSRAESGASHNDS